MFPAPKYRVRLPFVWLLSAFFHWSGLPLCFVVLLITGKLRLENGRLQLQGRSALLAYYCLLVCGLLTWVGLTALAISFDNWWILGGGIGWALFTQTTLGDFFEFGAGN